MSGYDIRFTGLPAASLWEHRHLLRCLRAGVGWSPRSQMLISSALVLQDRGQSEEEVKAGIALCDPAVHCFPPCAFICVRSQE